MGEWRDADVKRIELPFVDERLMVCEGPQLVAGGERVSTSDVHVGDASNHHVMEAQRVVEVPLADVTGAYDADASRRARVGADPASGATPRPHRHAS
jgi:hypothetical protein